MALKADVKGKVALITGGGGGIGSCTGRLFAQNGMRVILTDIVKEKGEKVAKTMQDEGLDVEFMYMDCNSKESIDECINAVIEKYGRVDVLMNNAGVNTGPDERKPVYNYNPEVFNWVVNINLHYGLVYITQKVIPFMIKQGGGSVLNTTSIAGVAGLRLQHAFVCSKFGMSALTKAMALEYAKYNIRVNALAPGSTWGPGGDKLYNPETDASKPFYERFTLGGQFENVPMNRPAGSEEMAGLMLYLASDDASYCTGQVIAVDGGWTAGFSKDY